MISETHAIPCNEHDISSNDHVDFHAENNDDPAVEKDDKINKLQDKSLETPDIPCPVTYKKENKFRLNAESVFFTYKTHVDIEKFIDFIINDKNHSIKFYVAGHEKADEDNPYEHTHILVVFDDKIDITNCRHFDFNNIHPHIGVTKSKIKAAQYTIKEGNYYTNDKQHLIDLLASKTRKTKQDQQILNIVNTIDKISKEKSLIDALKNNATELRDVMAIKIIHDSCEIPPDPELIEYLDNIKLLDWQKHIDNIMSQPPDRRTVHWYVDTVGNTGKSVMTDYFEHKYGDKFLRISASGVQAHHIYDIIRNQIKERRTYPKYYFFDLARGAANHKDLYVVIENIKNGHITCSKFKGGTLRFMPPTVIVFSNWYPLISDNTLSKDRFKVFEITGEDYNKYKKRLGVKHLSWDEENKRLMNVNKLKIHDVINKRKKSMEKDIDFLD